MIARQPASSPSGICLTAKSPITQGEALGKPVKSLTHFHKKSAPASLPERVSKGKEKGPVPCAGYGEHPRPLPSMVNATPLCGGKFDQLHAQGDIAPLSFPYFEVFRDGSVASRRLWRMKRGGGSWRNKRHKRQRTGAPIEPAGVRGRGFFQKSPSPPSSPFTPQLFPVILS